jgi:phage minor structural protein
VDTSRIIICSPTDVLLFELSPDDVWACDESIEINGPHTLEIVTTRVLTKEQRVLVFDEAEHAHEYVVASEDREHASGSIPFGTYKCAWSLQHDARLWKVDTDVGILSPVTASVALDAALSGTERWVKGSVTLVTTGGAEMHDMSGWEAFETVIATWGGEIDAEVVVGPTGVTARRVMLYVQMGNQTATRRFDYERDVESIQRHVLQDDVACRIIPLGKSEKNEYGFEHSVDIKSVNNNVEWLQNDDSAAIYRLAGPNGTYEYPIMYVKNTEMETAADLLAWGQSVLEEYTVPKVEYEMEVTYLYHESYHPFGVSLGDVIQCVDHGFGDTPLRLEARVTGMTIDRLDKSRSTVKVSNVRENRSLTSALAGISSLVNELVVVSGGITEYLDSLLDNINKEINARGGYVYITDGQGLRTYDKAVSDPLTGYTADYVTEMKGGSLRFAHEKENGEWKWTTVITPEGYLGLAATIANITTGFIGSASGGNYWNLDTGEFRLALTTTVGDANSSQTLAQYIASVAPTPETIDVDAAIYSYLTSNGKVQGIFAASNGRLYINASYINTGVLNAGLITSGKIQSQNGRVYFDLTNNELHCDKLVSTDSGTVANFSASIQAKPYYDTTLYGLVITREDYTDGAMTISPGSSYPSMRPSIKTSDSLELSVISGPSHNHGSSYIYIESPDTSVGIGGIYMAVSSYYGGHVNEGASIWLRNPTSSTSPTYDMELTTHYKCRWSFSNSGSAIYWGGYPPTFSSLTVSGNKNRVVETPTYGKRLLSSYETPEPLFGDVGSATTDADGVCVVSIDDVFQETARTDMAYQVFLQKCGRGDLWVSEKTPTHFVVEGTANLPFDWHVMAHQTGFETQRLEDQDRRDDAEVMGNMDFNAIDPYKDDIDYVREIESLYQDDLPIRQEEV